MLAKCHSFHHVVLNCLNVLLKLIHEAGLRDNPVDIIRMIIKQDLLPKLETSQTDISPLLSLITADPLVIHYLILTCFSLGDFVLIQML